MNCRAKSEGYGGIDGCRPWGRAVGCPRFPQGSGRRSPLNRSAVLWLALLLPVGARAQGDLGLDLTDDSPKKEQPKKEEAPAEPKASPKTREAKVTKNEGESPKAEANEEQAEREVILEDRVKAVQRKVYLKKSRFEISPMVGVSVNDPYYSKFALTGMAAYYLA